MPGRGTDSELVGAGGTRPLRAQTLCLVQDQQSRGEIFFPAAEFAGPLLWALPRPAWGPGGLRRERLLPFEK